MDTSRKSSRPPGRPRDAAGHQAALRVASDLLAREGFAAVTMESVAKRAGVSRPMLYRRWPNRATLAMDAFLTTVAPHLPFPDTGSVREDIRGHLHAVVEVFTSRTGRTLAELIAVGQMDVELAEALRSRYIAPRRAEMRVILERGIARGEFGPIPDFEVVIDAMYGPISHRLLIGHLKLDRHFADALTDLVVDGLSKPDEPGG